METDILLFTGILAAYREPIFRELGKDSSLCVLLSGTNALNRRTVEPRDDSRTRYIYLERKQFSIGSQYLELLPGLRDTLAANLASVYIIPDSPREFHSINKIVRCAKRIGAAVVCWSEYNEAALHYSGAARLVRTLQKKYYRNSDVFLASGIQACDYLIQNGVDESCIITQGQCMPSELITPALLAPRKTEVKGKRTWLFVGYLDELKGVQHLIRAFSRFATVDEALVIVGSGRFEKHLRDLASSDNRIHFTGHLDGEAKCSWYQAADYFVFPTLRDAWGLAVNEAMHFGLPVVVSSAAGCVFDLVLDEQTGLVVPPGDEQALEAACRRLRANPDLAVRLGNNGRTHVAVYSTAATVESFKRVVAVASSKLSA